MTKQYLAWIVEDNKTNQYLLDCIVQQKGFSTEFFENGLEVLEAYKTSTKETRPSVILMDINMPVMTGYESSRAIRKYELENNIPRVGIVAVTASDDEEKIMSENGLDGYVRKPLDINQRSKLFDFMYKMIGR